MKLERAFVTDHLTFRFHLPEKEKGFYFPFHKQENKNNICTEVGESFALERGI